MELVAQYVKDKAISLRLGDNIKTMLRILQNLYAHNLNLTQQFERTLAPIVLELLEQKLKEKLFLSSGGKRGLKKLAT